jgi:predicted nucleic-acid-binding Zn-ribbon protein
VIKRTFISNRKLPKLRRDNESDHGFTGLFPPAIAEEHQWLFPDKVSDPNFGIHGKTSKSSLAQAYRRIASSTVFARAADQDVPLGDLHEKKIFPSSYVLVEESRLQELIKLEEALQKERELLGQQCSTICTDYQISARLPLPATRYAIYSLCQQQMHKARTEIMKLQNEWFIFARQNHYNKPHLYIKDSYVKNAPLAQKAMKLRLVKEATETWLLRKERDTMTYEDNLSLLTCSYYDAMQRQKDYERYYILANRYGPFGEEEFHKDSRPGRRYYIKVTKGALKLQLLWDRFWAMAKLRRFRACRMIQKYVRRHIIYKRLHPLIRLRMKIGKKTYYIFCFAKWKEYNKLVRLIKDAFAFHLSNCKDLCFMAWRKYITDLRNHRTKLLSKIAHRTKNAPAFRALIAWKQFIQEIKDLKRRLRRLFGFPHFDIWVQFTKVCKHLKQLNLFAARVVAAVRAFIMRKRFLKKKAAQFRLWKFALMIFSQHLVQRKRRETIDQGFKKWKPEELQRRTTRLNEIERQRMQRRQLYIQEKERSSMKELQAHFISDDGQQQLQIVANEILSQEDSRLKGIFGWSAEVKQEAVNKAAKRLKRDYLQIIRKLEAFSYDAKYPCFIKCIFPKCGSTFSTEEQYHNHLNLSDIHTQEDEFVRCNHCKYTNFHMMLRHPKGLEAFRSYFVQKCGLSGVINYIDAWIALQDLKKSPANSQAFYKKAMAIYDLYLCNDATRKCDTSFEGKDAVLLQLQSYKEMNKIAFPGFYKKVELPPSFLQARLGVGKKHYVIWCGERVLDPQFIQDFEYQCFIALFKVFVEDTGFLASTSYNHYIEQLERDSGEKDNNLYKDYKLFRLELIREWTKDFKHHETLMAKKAYEAVDKVLDDEIHRIFFLMEKVEVKKRLMEIRQEEQLQQERMCLVVDESVAWCEENIIDFTFDFYARALLKAMWEVPEFRKGMLQYSGLIKIHMNKKMKLEIASNNAAKSKDDPKQWLDTFFLETSAAEKKTIPTGKDVAAIIIQKRIRGILGRSRARKLFTKIYKKYIDPQSNTPYYYNTRTKESSWNPPRLYKRLFGRSKW